MNLFRTKKEIYKDEVLFRFRHWVLLFNLQRLTEWEI